jgi:hypothetical protein
MLQWEMLPLFSKQMIVLKIEVAGSSDSQLQITRRHMYKAILRPTPSNYTAYILIIYVLRSDAFKRWNITSCIEIMTSA